jgi:hypothetical protein
VDAPASGDVPAPEEAVPVAEGPHMEAQQKLGQGVAAVRHLTREACERLSAAFSARPYQSSVVALGVLSLLSHIVCFSASWLETYARHGNDAVTIEVWGHADLSHMWSCLRQDRTEVQPGFSCVLFGYWDAPTKLNTLSDAFVATRVLIAFSFIFSVKAFVVAWLHRTNRKQVLERFSPFVASRIFAALTQGLAALFAMICFAVFAGYVDNMQANVPGAINLVTLGIPPTSVTYGAGFGFCILAWIFHLSSVGLLLKAPQFEWEAGEAPLPGASAPESVRPAFGGSLTAEEAPAAEGKLPVEEGSSDPELSESVREEDIQV